MRAAQRREGEACAELHALDRRNAEQDGGQTALHAVEHWAADAGRQERTAAIKRYTLERLQAAIPALRVISAGDVPHICAVTLPGYKSEVIVRVLGDQGICISSGSACHRGKPSHVFAALGLPKPWLDGALRLSFSIDSTREEADRLVAAMTEASRTLFTTLS